MTELADPLRLLREVAAVLDRLGLPYCVGGSWAAGLFGEPRMTRDLDLIVPLEAGAVEELAAALEPRFYVNRDAMLEAVRERRAFNAIDPESGLKVDFFVRGDSPFDHEEFRRRRAESFDEQGEIRLQVKSPEDSVLRKLLCYREGGSVSEQQWRDVLGILSVSAGTLDEAHLDHWAGELGLTDLLARARAEARD